MESLDQINLMIGGEEGGETDWGKDLMNKEEVIENMMKELDYETLKRMMNMYSEMKEKIIKSIYKKPIEC